MEQWVQGAGAYHRAVGAGKGTGAGVDGEMLVEVAELCEGPAARPAHKRTRISVQHRVHLHHSRTNPRISAHRTVLKQHHTHSFIFSFKYLDKCRYVRSVQMLIDLFVTDFPRESIQYQLRVSRRHSTFY